MLGFNDIGNANSKLSEKSTGRFSPDGPMTRRKDENDDNLLFEDIRNIACDSLERCRAMKGGVAWFKKLKEKRQARLSSMSRRSR